MLAGARTKLRSALLPAAVISATVAALLLVFPLGSPSFDTAYLLVWGRELGDLSAPVQSARFAPTPHPLFEVFGALVSPLGDGAWTATMVLAYLSLGLVAFLVLRLGEEWFDRPVGALAALILLTRAPVLANGLQAYVDLPYLALCLGALLIEVRKPRAGAPVLAALALAGLLRPEAWLFSAVYLGHLLIEVKLRPGRQPLRRSSWSAAWRDDRTGAEIAGLASLALAAPIGWAAFDLITAGDPLHSLTGTQATVAALDRPSGPGSFPLHAPRVIGEGLGRVAALAAIAGLILSAGLLRRRTATGFAAAALTLGSFALIACAGFAILPRYAIPFVSVLAIFAAAAILGWRLLDRADPWRRRWLAVALVLAIGFVVSAPHQADLLSDVSADLSVNRQLDDGMRDLVDGEAFDPTCGPVSIPNQRAAPRLAFWLGVSPEGIVSPPGPSTPKHGYFLAAGDRFVRENYIGDPISPVRREQIPAPGFARVGGNGSWLVYRRC